MKQLQGITPLVFSVLAIFLHYGNGAKILSLTFFSTKSHRITYDPLLNELAKRGHEVTIVSPVPSKSNSSNPKEILTYNYLEFVHSGDDIFELKAKGEEFSTMKVFHLFEKKCELFYSMPQIRNLLNEKFDLVIHEAFMNECAAGLLYKLNTTLIIMSPVSVPSEIVRMLGGPAPPSFIPGAFSPYDNQMNFIERFWNFVIEVKMDLVKAFFFESKMEAIYRKSLKDSSIPGVKEILRNSSLTLSNSHTSLGGARPFMPDVIEVGGMHMRKAKPLPRDLEAFAHTSGDAGFIFFSMGSILQGSNLPEAQRQILLRAFSKLKQKVLWKFESDSVPDLPSNVKLIKWAPQQDILGHPKCRAFITHGGLGSTTEAIYHGVPFIGIPMFADQLTNIEKFIRLEVALRLEFAELEEGNIINTIETLINDSKYLKNVKQLSRIFRDQSDNPLERAVYWIEYVLRHKGAVHLRSPARDLNFFQYHSLDVLSVLLTTVLICIFLTSKIVKLLFAFCTIRLIGGSKNCEKPSKPKIQ